MTMNDENETVTINTADGMNDHIQNRRKQKVMWVNCKTSGHRSQKISYRMFMFMLLSSRVETKGVNQMILLTSHPIQNLRFAEYQSDLFPFSRYIFMLRCELRAY